MRFVQVFNDAYLPPLTKRGVFCAFFREQFHSIIIYLNVKDFYEAD
jgi:hypothetical protein